MSDRSLSHKIDNPRQPASFLAHVRRNDDGSFEAVRGRGRGPKVAWVRECRVNERRMRRCARRAPRIVRCVNARSDPKTVGSGRRPRRAYQIALRSHSATDGAGSHQIPPDRIRDEIPRHRQTERASQMNHLLQLVRQLRCAVRAAGWEA